MILSFFFFFILKFLDMEVIRFVLARCKVRSRDRNLSELARGLP